MNVLAMMSEKCPALRWVPVSDGAAGRHPDTGRTLVDVDPVAGGWRVCVRGVGVATHADPMRAVSEVMERVSATLRRAERRGL